MIAEYVLPKMLKCLSAFLDFCYLVRWSDFDKMTRAVIKDTIYRFHQHCKIFKTTGVHDNFSLPCQHSILHYLEHIQEVGAPNGLCSSITESWHITAVKKPWWRSIHNNPLLQILKTNEHLDKLAALRVHFVDQGMLLPLYAPPPTPLDEDEDDGGPVDDHVLAEVTLAHT